LRQLLQEVSAYELFVFEYGFRPSHPSLVALFASIFLHGGLVHLLGNMLFLWIYGDNVEHRLGSLLYTAAYIATGVVATSFHAVFNSDSGVPLVGASGAISGVLGFYFIWFPHNYVRLMVLLFPLVMDTVQVRARLVLGAYLVIDNILPFLGSSGTGGGVAHGAHIGGFLAGLLLALLTNRREVTATPNEYAAAEPDGSESLKARLRSAVRSGDLDEAARLYFALPPEATRQALMPAELLELGNWLERNGHMQAALIVYRRHLRDFPRGPGTAEAHLGAGRVLLNDFGEATAAYQHFLDALDSNPSPVTAASAREAVERIAAAASKRRR
jgi:membrane associated rhomboid family serine protease